MVSREIFYERLNGFCAHCEHWSGVCLKGHDLRSPTGCPVQKFSPVDGAGYDQDRPVAERVLIHGCCGAIETVPKMTWTEVVANFWASMRLWLREGVPLTTMEQHEERFGVCRQNKCGKYKNFQCSICRCVAYAKAKVATEDCPLGMWPLTVCKKH